MSRLPATLESTYEKEQARLSDLVDAFPWEDKHSYGSWLIQSYQYACKSTRILALTSAHFRPEHNAHHYRFAQHAMEEKGHEKLLINDLKALGMTIDDVPEMPEMAAFYQSLYYWIEHVDSISIFGWVLCLEGLAVLKGPEMYRRALAAHGSKASGFLKVHSTEDVDHMEKAFQNISTIEGKDLLLIQRNFEQCCQLYGLVLRRITESATTGVEKKAA